MITINFKLGSFQIKPNSEGIMESLWLLLLVIGGWIALNKWILPKLGITT